MNDKSPKLVLLFVFVHNYQRFLSSHIGLFEMAGDEETKLIEFESGKLKKLCTGMVDGTLMM